MKDDLHTEDTGVEEYVNSISDHLSGKEIFFFLFLNLNKHYSKKFS